MKSICSILTLILMIGCCLAAPTLKIISTDPSYYENIVCSISSDVNFQNVLLSKNIHIYKDQREINTDIKLYSYNGTYYFYFQPKSAGEYSIVTDELMYKSGDSVVSKVLNTTFEVSDSTENALFISPGVVNSKNPQIIITNVGTNDLTVSYGETSFSLDTTASKTLEIPVTESLELFEITAESKKYIVPVIYIKPLNETINSSDNGTEETYNLVPGDKTIILTGYENSQTHSTFEFLNMKNNTIKNFNLATDISFLKIDYYQNLTIEPKGLINITLNYVYSTEGVFNGSLNVSYTEQDKNYSYLVPVKITILSPLTESSSKTCAELGGELCEGTEVCKIGGETKYTIDGYCCLETECVSAVIDKTSGSDKGSGWIIGVIIMFVIGVVGYIIYTKYKKVGKKTNPITGK